MQAASLALALVLGTGQPDAVLYDFGRPSCFYCQVMNPIVDRLIEEGHPIVKVNCDQQGDLARQYQVHSLPTFLLVVNGRVVDRCEGQQSEGRLREMLARIPEPEPEPEPQSETQPVPEPEPEAQRPRGLANETMQSAQSPSSAAPPSSNHAQMGEPGPFPEAFQRNQGARPADPRELAERQTPVAPPSTSPPVPRDRTQNPSLQVANQPQSSNGSRVLGNNPDSDAFPPAVPGITSMAASVRIRVIHGGRVNLGSGTIILSQQGRSLIITCGHIFRDATGDAKIEVDVFHGSEAQTYVGTLTDFDLESEIGLITIPTERVLPTVAIVPADCTQQVNDHVASIGCSGGNAPSREQHRISAINKYEGPDNLECNGTPVEGRSGGGLFNNDEQLIGVCFARGESEPLGLYAGPKAMYAMLDKYGLTSLYTPAQPTQPEPPQVAQGATQAMPFDQMESQGHPGLLELGQPTTQPFAPNPAPRAPATGNVAPNVTTTSAPLDFDAGEAEVVCLITEPDGSRRVIVLHRASPKFVAYLNGELDGDESLTVIENNSEYATGVTAQRVPRPSSAPVMNFATATPAARPYTMQGFQPTSLVQPMAPRAYVRQR